MGATDPRPQSDYVAVAVSTEMIAQLAGNGDSEPVVLVAIKPYRTDGAHTVYEMVLRRPSRAELQAETLRRFQAPDRSRP